MYNYNIKGYVYNIILENEKQYTQEEFEALCKEAPHNEDNYYDIYELTTHLEKYNFKWIEYQASFFTDGD